MRRPVCRFGRVLAGECRLRTDAPWPPCLVPLPRSRSHHVRQLSSEEDVNCQNSRVEADYQTRSHLAYGISLVADWNRDRWPNRSGVPDPHSPVVAAAGQQLSAVDGERAHRSDRVLMAYQGADLLASAGVPDPHRLVVAAVTSCKLPKVLDDLLPA